MNNTFYSNQFFHTQGIQSIEFIEDNKLLINNILQEKYFDYVNFIIIDNLDLILYKFENNYLYGWNKVNEYYLFSNISMDYSDVFIILNKILLEICYKKEKIEDMITQYKIIINSRNINVANSVLSLGCLSQPISKQGYFPTLYPSECADLFRSHAVVNGGLPINFSSDNINTSTINSLESPTFGYTREKNQLFVIGGSPTALYPYTQGIINSVATCQNDISIIYTPYVALLDKDSNNYFKTLLTIGESVNYIGGLLMHQNGYIYAVNRCVLYKIDPYDLTIIKYIKLPYIKNKSQPNLDLESIYNGMQVIKNGTIIIKGYNFSNDNGIFLQIDPNNLNILVEKLLNDPPVAPRISIYQDPKTNIAYYYSINTTEIERIIITENDFIIDSNYSSQYRTNESKNNPGNAVLIFDKINKISFASNAFCGPEEGMQLYNYDLENKSDVREKFAFNFESNNPGYNFWMVASDNIINQFVIGYDPVTKKISCNKILESGEFIFVWEKNNLTISACIACVADRNHLYINDYVNGIDYFVVLELTTGNELFRIKTLATLPTLGNIVPGINNDVYLFSQQIGESKGYITRFYV